MTDYDRTHPFVERAAKFCHHLDRQTDVFLENNPLPEWDSLPDWAHRVLCHMVYTGFYAFDSVHPRYLHKHWLYAMNAEGRSHPNMVPYDDLGRVQKTKYYLYTGVIRKNWDLWKEIVETAAQDGED